MIDDKGVMDLPVKLAVVFLILSISVPVIANAVERNESISNEVVMDSEMARFSKAVAAAHYSGTGSTVTVMLDIPTGFEIRVGGDGSDSYSIRSYSGDSLISKRYMERPAVMLLCDLTIGQGRHTLSITSTLMDGRAAAEVVPI